MPIVWRIALSFAGVIVLTVLLTVAGNLTVEKQLLLESQRRELRQYAETVRADVAAAGEQAVALSTLVANLPGVAARLAGRDRDGLRAMFAPAFQALRQNSGIAQFHFHVAPWTSFLRLHDPDRFGDDTTEPRRTVTRTNELQEHAHGLDVGVAGVGIRGAVPIVRADERLGSVEFGVSFGQQFFNDFKARHGVDASLYLSQAGQLLFYAGSLARPGLVDPEQLQQAFAGEDVLLSAVIDGETYGVLASPMRDSAGEPIGVIIVAENMRHYFAITARSYALFVGVGLLALTLGLMMAWVVSRSVAEPIGEVTATMSRIVEEDLSITIPAQDRPDEIGAMARAVQSFRQAMLASRALKAEHDANVTAKQRLSLLADNAFEGLLVCDNGRIVDCNKRFEAMIGRPVADLVDFPLLDLISAEDHSTITEHDAHAGRDAHELSLLRADGTVLAVEVLSRRADERTPNARLYAFRDISEQKRADERIRFLAHHDTLTKLPNRTQFLERLEESLKSAQRSGVCVAVLFLDLDHFKDVNDILGHAAGDRMLELVALRLSQCLRSHDLVARLGGDEFAVIASGLNECTSVARIAERIIQSLSEPFDLDGHEAVIGCTIGIARSGGTITSAQDMLRNAVIALYHGKNEGRCTYRFFEDRMNTELKKQKSLQHELRRALGEGQFHLNYQPQVDLQSGRIVGLEALLRWTHPDLGQIPPGEFIPMAEETGLIASIGEWVLRTACEQARDWPGITVAVNLSPAQFMKPGLEDLVAAVLRETGLGPERLELEITERILLRDTEATLKVLRAIGELGVLISMDDFGTGYSSLGYLRRFPFDKIKLDRSFISDVEADGDESTIVRAVLGLGRNLGITTIAEGVETPGQRQFLIREGCDQGQGYLFGRPMAAADIPHVIARTDLLPAVHPALRPVAMQARAGR